MVYSYDEKKQEVKLEKIPKLHGRDAQRVENADVPKEFLKKVMGIKLNIQRA